MCLQVMSFFLQRQLPSETHCIVRKALPNDFRLLAINCFLMRHDNTDNRNIELVSTSKQTWKSGSSQQTQMQLPMQSKLRAIVDFSVESVSSDRHLKSFELKFLKYKSSTFLWLSSPIQTP